MERSKAIELLKNAVPAKALPDDEIGFFIEAVSMAIKSLEQAHFVSGNTLVVTLPEEDLKATNRVLLDCKPWAKIFYADGGKDINVPSNSALDHIHNVVAEREYQRGYEQGKADTAPKWIPISERLPEEGQRCLVCDNGWLSIDTFVGHGNPYNWKLYVRDYEAWMPLPEPYKEE
jgi:hypothetical protein